MKSSCVTIMTGCILLFFSCKKDPPMPDTNQVQANSKAFPLKIVFDKSTTQTPWQVPLPVGYNPDSTLSYMGGPGYYFSYNSQQSISGLRLNTDLYTYNYNIHYNTNNLPDAGTRTYVKVNNNNANSFDQVITDSIIYKLENGMVVEARFYNRRIIVAKNSNTNPNIIVSDTTYSKDTVESYKITYLDGNINKIRLQEKTGRIVDMEYTYGTGKGIFYSCQQKFMVVPDQFLISGFLMIVNHSKNELLRYKRTYVSENNRVEESVYSYSFNQNNFPSIITVADSGLQDTTRVNTGHYKMLIGY